MKKKYIIMLLIIGIFLTVSVILGTSFALWRFTVSQEGVNAISTECFELTFVESDGFILDNAYPMTTSEMQYLITNDLYPHHEFEIKNICNTAMNYYINIETLEGSDLDLEYVNYFFYDGENYKVDTLDNVDTGSNVLKNSIDAREIETGVLWPNETKTYYDALWINEYATQEDIANKRLETKITVYSYLERNVKTIALHPNGGQVESEVFYTHDDGSFEKLPTATKEGYYLEGWYSDENLTNKIYNSYTQVTDVTDLYAKWVYKDSVIATAPEVYQGLIPITLSDSGVITAVEETSNWYDYANHRWANAILVTDKSKYLDEDGRLLASKVNTVVPMEDVAQMYVWIPRYRYKLFNADFSGTEAQAIDIEFESVETPKSRGSRNWQWLTHPAFTFGDRELPGFWVGKFETSHTIGLIKEDNKNKLCTSGVCDTQNIRILPNKVSLVNNKLSIMSEATAAIKSDSTYGLSSDEVDTHVMKNMEWGAVAYLSNSIYGIYKSDKSCNNNQKYATNYCRVYRNPLHVGYGTNENVNNLTYEWGSSYTGCGASSVNADIVLAVGDNEAYCESGYNWNEAGVNASTTGNITGIYDMAGGANELVMANVSSSESEYIFNAARSGFTSMPDEKYLDTYLSANLSLSEEAQQKDQKRGHLGDATSETIKIYGNTNDGWNRNKTSFPTKTYAWMERGGHAVNGATGSLFAIYRDYGNSTPADTFRIVLSLDEEHGFNY